MVFKWRGLGLQVRLMCWFLFVHVDATTSLAARVAKLAYVQTQRAGSHFEDVSPNVARVACILRHTISDACISIGICHRPPPPPPPPPIWLSRVYICINDNHTATCAVYLISPYANFKSYNNSI